MVDLIKILRQVEKAVLKASKIVLEKDYAVMQKDSQINLVTQVDIDVQNALVIALKKILPDAGFIGEENHLEENDKEYCWVIDPIDGTFNFIKGISHIGISVGLIKDNQPILGVVYNPFAKDLYTAAKGFGAYRNGKQIHVSNAPFEKSIMCTAMSLYNKDLAKTCSNIIYDVYMQANDVRRFGTTAMEICYLAAGLVELFFEIRVFPWDYAGAYAILQEAGGVLYGLNKQVPAFNGPTPLLGANSKENFEKLNAIVSKYMKEVPYNE